MPLPIAHSVAGLAGYFAFKKANPDSPPKQELFLLGLCMLLANLPDLDFIPGFLCGEPGRFHHGPSHSLVVGLVGALIFYRFVRSRLKGISKKRIFGCCLVSLLSHPILDYLSADTSKPFGVPLFWPFDIGYYMSPVSLFRDVQRNQDTIGTFFASIINNNNAWGIAVESLFSGTILFALFAFKRRYKRVLSLFFFLLSMLCGLFYYSLQIKPNLI
ncbi:MAG: metal-dependent hydrolase [Deltaproteobacteria bacterium]|nr:metal-dependent hydrolase [Deltaproteobacteria bacterium]